MNLSKVELNAQEKKGGGPKHVFTGPAPSHPFDVILARPTDTSVTLSLLAYQELTARIVWGEQSGQLDQSMPVRSLRPGEPSEWLLTGLKPNTRYYYQLQTRTVSDSNFRADVEHSFHTQRKLDSSFTFTIQSDSHLDQGTRPAIYERTLLNALSDKPDFHIDIGDTFMTDKYGKDYKTALPQYIAQRYYFGQVAHSAPLFLVLGNHDGEKQDAYNGTEDCMAVWSCRNRKRLFPNPQPDTFYTGNLKEQKHIGKLENYYAWEWGNSLFIALDPFWYSPRPGKNNPDAIWSRTLGKDQYDWLASTLANSKAKFKFVFIHHLVGGLDENGRGGAEAAGFYEWGGRSKNGKDEFPGKRPGWEMPIHQLLVKYKVSAVFHGHDHFYAHQELDDVKYIMVPQPGHPGADRVRNAEEYGYIRGDFHPPAGYIRVSITADTAKLDYVRTALSDSENVTKKNKQIAHTSTIYSPKK